MSEVFDSRKSWYNLHSLPSSISFLNSLFVIGEIASSNIFPTATSLLIITPPMTIYLLKITKVKKSLNRKYRKKGEKRYVFRRKESNLRGESYQRVC
jgi:hypothetical protein